MKVSSKAVLDRLAKTAKDNIFQISLKNLNLPSFQDYGPRGFARPYIPANNELFINGEGQRVAQWPNVGEKAIKIGKIHDKGSVPRHGDFSNRGGTFEWNHDRPLRWQEADNFYLSGLFQNGYADDTVKVAKIDFDKKCFVTQQPHLYGFGNRRPWNTWVAKNLLEEIDQPGEYFLDKKTKMLYFYPKCSISEIKSIALSLLTKPMVSLMNASHIRFENLTFENSCGMGGYIEGGEHCLFKGCTFRNLGMVAVSIGKGTKPSGRLQHDSNDELSSNEIGSLYTTMYNNTTLNRGGGAKHGVVDCKIYDVGADGVVFGGGDRKTFNAAGNWRNNWGTKTDPGFVNLKKGNFNLKSDAEVYKRIDGFKTIPFSKIGLIKEEGK